MNIDADIPEESNSKWKQMIHRKDIHNDFVGWIPGM